MYLEERDAWEHLDSKLVSALSELTQVAFKFP